MEKISGLIWMQCYPIYRVSIRAG